MCEPVPSHCYEISINLKCMVQESNIDFLVSLCTKSKKIKGKSMKKFVPLQIHKSFPLEEYINTSYRHESSVFSDWFK